MSTILGFGRHVSLLPDSSLSPQHSGMTFLPFSPRWLASKGRDEEAMSVLMRLHGARAERSVVEAEYAEMVLQIDWERENVSNNFMDLFKTWPKLHRTLCGVLVQVCCQWTGVNVKSVVWSRIDGSPS